MYFLKNLLNYIFFKCPLIFGEECKVELQVFQSFSLLKYAREWVRILSVHTSPVASVLRLQRQELCEGKRPGWWREHGIASKIETSGIFLGSEEILDSFLGNLYAAHYRCEFEQSVTDSPSSQCAGSSSGAAREKGRHGVDGRWQGKGFIS